MVHLFSISKIEYYFPHPSKKLFIKLSTEPEEIEFYENFSCSNLRFVRIVALYKKIINRKKKYKVEGDIIGGRLMSIVYTIATMASLFT